MTKKLTEETGLNRQEARSFVNQFFEEVKAFKPGQKLKAKVEDYADSQRWPCWASHDEHRKPERLGKNSQDHN